MSVKVHFKGTHDDTNFVCDNVAAAGAVVSYNARGQVSKSTGVTNEPAGVLLTEVVTGVHPSNINLGEFTGTINIARNRNKNQTHVSGQVRLLKVGEVETNQVVSTDTFGAGSGIYLAGNGLISTSVSGADLVVRTKIGHALAAKDSDGFVKVFVNIQ